MKEYTQEFIAGCLRTDSNDFDKIKDRLTRSDVTFKYLAAILREYISLVNQIDMMKKYLFYGKTSSDQLSVSAEFFDENIELSNLTHSNIRLLHAGLGMATESAEFLEQLVDHIFNDQVLDEINLQEECGDFLWYASIALNALGESSYIPTMEKVLNKLWKRYPDKFTEECAVNRNLEEERKVLES